MRGMLEHNNHSHTFDSDSCTAFVLVLVVFFFSANAIRLHSAVHRWQSCVNKFILRKNFCSVFIYCACNLKCFELVHSLPILLCAEHSCGSIRTAAAAAKKKKESKSTTILDVSNAEMAHMVSLPLPLTSVLPVD